MEQNFQFVDGEFNPGFFVFRVNSIDFDIVFPNRSDISFLDEVIRSLDASYVDSFIRRIFSRKIAKSEVCGINGMLFNNLDNKKRFYPNRLESDIKLGRAAFFDEKCTDY